MHFKKYLKTIDSTNHKNPLYEDSSSKEYNEYFNILDPDTGDRFDIPLLSPSDPGYFFKYVYYMKLKENSPETFKKILTWE